MRKSVQITLLLSGLALLSLFTLGGCSTVGYYGQSVVGHTRLMLARENIDNAISRSHGERKRQLELAKVIRRYAVTDLALPDNKSYLSYVDLEREYPVWSVVAAREFSLTPQQWCYPVIGCAAYRGYFAKRNAQQYAEGLQKKGFETHVGGATAYSTLGWFTDPLIPSMMRNGDMFLAQVMFHELAHQQLYIKGYSAFNEAFATVVGEQGTLKWLRSNVSTSDGSKSDLENTVKKYQQLMQVRNDFSLLIKQYKAKLSDIYALPLNDFDKRKQKQTMLTDMRETYEQLVRNQWQGKRWYGSWMKTAPNNAKLAAFSTYRELVPAFERLLALCNNDIAKFYRVVANQKGKGRAAVIATECEV